MNKLSFLTTLAGLCFTVSAVGQVNSEKTIKLKIIETSDVHGCFFPYDFIEHNSTEGSMARINTYIERQRKEYGDRLLLLDNGDILQGQPLNYWTNYVQTSEENMAASVLNYMKYDAATMGNHDVETGHNVYDKWISEVRCPMLGANIIETATKKPYVKPYAMFEREGVKIAVLGMLTPTIACWLNEEIYAGMDFQNMVDCARYWIQRLRQEERPDVIVGLFHSGFNGGIKMANGLEEDASEKVAREVEGFDVIFFGHDHVQRNVRLKNPKERDVLCLDPSCFAQNVAEATIELIYKNGKLAKKVLKGNVVSMKNEPIDQQMIEAFKPQIEAIRQYVDRRIGTFTNGASTRDSYFGTSAFTDFIHEMMLNISGADISFNAPLAFDSSIKEGPVTVGDMFNLYRFENKLYVLRMTGREILGHLEMSYDLWANTMKNADDHLLLLNTNAKGDQQRMGFKNFTFNFDSASGIDYEVDVTKPDGKKVTILRMSNGQPFELDKTYQVAMNSYRGNGGGELLIRGAGIPKDKLSERIIYQSPLDLRHYIMQEIERRGTVSPRAAANWRFVPEAWTVPAAKRDRKLIFGD